MKFSLLRPSVPILHFFKISQHPVFPFFEHNSVALKFIAAALEAYFAAELSGLKLLRADLQHSATEFAGVPVNGVTSKGPKKPVPRNRFQGPVLVPLVTSL